MPINKKLSGSNFKYLEKWTVNITLIEDLIPTTFFEFNDLLVLKKIEPKYTSNINVN